MKLPTIISVFNFICFLKDCFCFMEDNSTAGTCITKTGLICLTDSKPGPHMWAENWLSDLNPIEMSISSTCWLSLHSVLKSFIPFISFSLLFLSPFYFFLPFISFSFLFLYPFFFFLPFFSLSLLFLYPFYFFIPFFSLSLFFLYPFFFFIPFISLSLFFLYPFCFFIPFISLSLLFLYPFCLFIVINYKIVISENFFNKGPFQCIKCFVKVDKKHYS